MMQWDARIHSLGEPKIRHEWRDIDTRVFTPDGLLRYVRNQQPQLTCREIELIASHLDRSARSQHDPKYATVAFDDVS
jgi:hypothetical protein